MIRVGRNLPDARPQETLAELPASVDLSPSKAVAVGRFLICVFAFIFVFAFRSHFAAFGGDPSASVIGAVIPLGVAAVGLYVGARGVLGLLSRRTARFDAGSVRVTGRTPFGREEWTQPLSAFEGVVWRVIRQRRRRRAPRVWQVIELVHPDPARTLPLYVRQTRRDAREEWEGIARTLHVPAIDARHGAPHARAPEDIDKTVRELAAEGRLGATWQPGSEPPAGLSWQSEGGGEAPESLVVRLHARRFPLWLYLLPAAIGAFAAYDGVMDGELFAVPIGLALIAAPAAYWLAEPGRPRELRITRDDVRLADPMPLGKDAGPLRLERIEEIRVAAPRNRLVGADTLVIASDAGEIRTGQGLSAEALEWLRAYLTTAVVTAD